MELDIIWQQCLTILKEHFGEQEYNTWFRGLRVKLENHTIKVMASNRLVLDFIKNKFWNKISEILEELSDGANTELSVTKPDTLRKLIASTSATQPAEPQESNSSIANETQDIHNHKNPNSNNDYAQNGELTTKNTTNQEDNIDKQLRALEALQAKNSADHAHMVSNKNKTIKTSRTKLDKEILASLHSATKLNPNYIFDSFVTGNSNQIAYAIGRHITQKPGHKNHNPLFVYGRVGLGKTHLMQAIGNEIHKLNPKAKIRYLHANDYIQDVVKASMRQGFDELKKYYNSLDLLLMDDIQFIAGDKTKTQEEFFYTFNTLLERNKQIIMTCDTYPKNITNLNERLISRFASGITVEIQPPELEMRVAILKCKAEQSKVYLDDEVAFFVAQNIKSNVRELEGALNKVVYHAQFSGKGVSLPIAREALMDILAVDSKNLSIDEIQKAVCDFFKIRISDLLSPKRTQSISRPRQIAMTLCKELTQHSLPTIGNAFGGRDHTTVIHAQKTVKALRGRDEKFDKEFNLLVQMLHN